ncbi:TetR/AcrR family transcriptional regulator [Niveispirillum fermenti]|uniref:TetR/AcrR family transcriptional regulator n=1 Tax=Niveispirillum fermenti TaxID=1233113 RepID=UPI003A8AEA34
MTNASKAASSGARVRHSATDRRQQMIDAADQIVNRDRSPDLSLREVADMVGASRALVYAYFPDKLRLLDAVLQQHVDRLLADGIVQAASRGALVERACAVSRLYLRHVAQYGAALELVVRDEPLARQLEGAASRLRGRLYRALARAARLDLHMPAHEAVALVQLLAVIPEEAGKHVRMQVLTVPEAEALSDRLMGAAIAAQVPRPGSGRPG